MTRIGDTDRIAANFAFEAASSGAASVAASSAMALASGAASRRTQRTGSAQGASTVPVTDRVQQSDLAAIGAAFAGSPESFLARIALEMRRSNTALKESGIRAETSAADTAEKAREAAEAAAAKAAEQATGFLGLSEVFDVVAKIASVVVSVAATVVTAGAAAPVAAGLLLMTFGGDLADLAVEAGLCPESLRDELATALKMTGAIMITAVTLGAGVAAIGSVALEATSEDIVAFAAETFDMSDAARAALTVGLSVAGSVLAGIAGGAAGAGKGLADGATRTALATARDVGRAVTVGAHVASAATGIGVAVSEHDAAYSRADAQEASTTRDAAYDEADGHIEGLKSALKAYGRAMKMARQAQEARGQAMRAATQQRA